MPFHLEVVTADRSVFSDEVDEVIAPGVDGEFGVLGHHEPLLAALHFGNLRIKQGATEIDLALGGGFLEVRDDRCTVLADSAERAEEIDIRRAEEARQRASEQIAMSANQEDLIRAEAALRRAEARIRTASRRNRNLGGPSAGSSGA